MNSENLVHCRHVTALGMRGLMLWICLSSTMTMARNLDGALDLLQTPHNGQPALVLPGGTFTILATQQAPVSLVGAGGTIALQPAWQTAAGGRWQGSCPLPLSVAPGMYTLQMNGNDRTDRNLRAVFVYAQFPEFYSFGHITDMHIGSQRGGVNSALRNTAILKALNKTNVAFVVATGDLTDGAGIVQFKQLLQVLDTCRHPTFVCPGNHDREGEGYERYFGPLTYCFTFGRDGYLAFDTKDYYIADEWGSQDGDLCRFRCELKPCRFTFGLTHRYDPSMGMRSQLILFVDNPLTHLFMGHTHRENRPSEKRVQWGTTPYTMTPAAINGNYRIVDVTAQGALPRPTEKAADTAQP
jgi:predicted phosphodiesterase